MDQDHDEDEDGLKDTWILLLPDQQKSPDDAEPQPSQFTGWSLQIF